MNASESSSTPNRDHILIIKRSDLSNSPPIDEIISSGQLTTLPSRFSVERSGDHLGLLSPINGLLRLELKLSPTAHSHREQLLFVRLFAALLELCPESPAIEAHFHEHASGEGVYLLKGLDWSLELITSILEESNDEYAVLELNRASSVRIRVDESDDDMSLTRINQWRSSVKLLLRAKRFGVAQQSTEAEIHPSATLHPSVEISGAVVVGAETKIWHFSKLLGPLKIGERCSFGQNVVIERGVDIGNNVKVQNNVSIYAGVILEDDVFCGPSMVFTNVGTPRSHYPRRDAYSVTRVGKGASIGANATIVCGHSLGRYSFVGAGAVVTKDVPDFALVYGNPARVRAWACYCGVKLSFLEGNLQDTNKAQESTCEECSRVYRLEGMKVTPLSKL